MVVAPLPRNEILESPLYAVRFTTNYPYEMERAQYKRVSLCPVSAGLPKITPRPISHGPFPVRIGDYTVF